MPELGVTIFANEDDCAVDVSAFEVDIVVVDPNASFGCVTLGEESTLLAGDPNSGNF